MTNHNTKQEFTQNYSTNSKSTAKRCSIINLIIGIIIFIGSLIVINNAPVYVLFVLIRILGPFVISGEIINVILLVSTIINSSKQKNQTSPIFIIIAVLGTVLSFYPFIYIALENI